MASMSHDLISEIHCRLPRGKSCAAIVCMRCQKYRSMTPRDALKQALRDKKERRTGGAAKSDPKMLARTMKADPTTALLSMGVDDPAMLHLGKTIAADPRRALRALKSVEEAASAAGDEAGDELDDEAPPPDA